MALAPIPTTSGIGSSTLSTARGGAARIAARSGADTRSLSMWGQWQSKPEVTRHGPRHQRCDWRLHGHDHAQRARWPGSTPIWPRSDPCVVGRRSGHHRLPASGPYGPTWNPAIASPFRSFVDWAMPSSSRVIWSPTRRITRRKASPLPASHPGWSGPVPVTPMRYWPPNGCAPRGHGRALREACTAPVTTHRACRSQPTAIRTRWTRKVQPAWLSPTPTAPPSWQWISWKAPGPSSSATTSRSSKNISSMMGSGGCAHPCRPPESRRRLTSIHCPPSRSILEHARSCRQPTASHQPDHAGREGRRVSGRRVAQRQGPSEVHFEGPRPHAWLESSRREGSPRHQEEKAAEVARRCAPSITPRRVEARRPYRKSRPRRRWAGSTRRARTSTSPHVCSRSRRTSAAIDYSATEREVDVETLG